MEIRTDRRRLEVHEDREAVDAFRRGHGVIRGGEIEVARALVRIERSRSFVVYGYASVVDFAVGDGMDARRARELRDFGRTLDLVPEVEKQVRDARVTPQTAAAVGKVVRRAASVKEPPKKEAVAAEGRRLLAFAKDAQGREFRDETRKSEEEIAQRGREAFTPPVVSDDGTAADGQVQQGPKDPLVSRTFVVPESSLDRFFRAKDLAERRAERSLTEGEAFSAITDDFLRHHDAMLRKPRKRRVGPTSERPRDRYVPAEVERAVRERAGDRCEVPGCGNRVFLEFAHIRAQEDDGDREFGNLLLLCSRHHVMYDARLLLLRGVRAEGPVFVVAETGEVFEPQRSRAPPPRPPPLCSPEPEGRTDHGGEAAAPPGDLDGDGPRRQAAPAAGCSSGRAPPPPGTSPRTSERTVARVPGGVPRPRAFAASDGSSRSSEPDRSSAGPETGRGPLRARDRRGRGTVRRDRGGASSVAEASPAYGDGRLADGRLRARNGVRRRCRQRPLAGGARGPPIRAGPS